MNGEEWNKQVVRSAISFLDQEGCPFRNFGNPNPYCPFLGPFIDEKGLEERLEEARNHCPFIGYELNNQGHVNCKKYIRLTKELYRT